MKWYASAIGFLAASIAYRLIVRQAPNVIPSDILIIVCLLIAVLHTVRARLEGE